MASKKNDALTGMRALAAVYILFMHFGGPLFRSAPRWVQTVRESGYIATSFFLMLSGFVLTYAYGRKLAAGKIDRRSFLIQRVSRLYPSYGLAILLILPFAFVHRWGVITSSFGDTRVRWRVLTGTLHATMSHVWFPRWVTSWDVPGWCVSCEMWFYLVFPFVVVWALGRRSSRTLWLAALGCWGLALASSIAYTVIEPDGIAASIHSTAPWLSFWKFSPPSRIPEFMFGVMLGAIYVRLPEGKRLEKQATPLLAIGAAAGFGVLLMGEHVPYSMLHNGTLLPLYGMVVWSLMAGDGPLHRLLSARPLVKMGDASYQLYILQVPLMMWAVLIGGRQYGHDSIDAPFTAVALPCIIACALLLQRFWQPRMQEWLRTTLSARFGRQPATITLPATTMVPTVEPALPLAVVVSPTPAGEALADPIVFGPQPLRGEWDAT